MEKYELHVVEEERCQSSEAGTQREGVRGTEIDDGEEQGELTIDVLEL